MNASWRRVLGVGVALGVAYAASPGAVSAKATRRWLVGGAAGSAYSSCE